MKQNVDGLIVERERVQRKVEILKNLKNSDLGSIESNRIIIENRIRRLQNKKSEITVRIRTLDPSALPDAPKKLVLSVRGQRISLDKRVLRSSSSTLASFVSAKDAPAPETNAEFEQWFREAVEMMTDLEATAFDLRYNKGYSLKKISEVMGKDNRTHYCGVIRRGVFVIELWIKIRSSVKVCMRNDAMDWKRFLAEVPEIWTELERKSIEFSLSDESKSVFAIFDFNEACGVSYRAGSIHSFKTLGRIKRMCEFIGIPVSETDKLHPLFKRVTKFPHVDSPYRFMQNNLRITVGRYFHAHS